MMGDRNNFERDEGFESPVGRYLIVRPENGGIGDLFRFGVWGDKASGLRFVEGSYGGVDIDDDDNGYDDAKNVVMGDEIWGSGDHRWVIVVSILVRKIIAIFGKPMEWVGYVVDFVLNLLSLNGDFIGLAYNLVHATVVMPRRGTETFISTIGHLDGRIDLFKARTFMDRAGDSTPVTDGSRPPLQTGDRVLMDLCIMASKLAYENASVVRDVVVNHWKMHFIDFYNCWNDFQQEKSTQVFILSDKPKDANFILISFRGTEPFDADDWSTDFDYSWYEIPKLGKVHMGFLEALGLGNRADAVTFHNNLLVVKNSNNVPVSSSEQELEPYMVELTAYHAVRNKLTSLLKEHKNAKFLVTGHSLGGALAILFPTVLLLQEEHELMEKLLAIYTFGQPRIGNEQLGKFVEARLNQPKPKYFRIVYCNDLVPRLPYDDKLFLYKHFGVCLYYSSCYVDQKVDEEPNRNYFGIRFLIPEYINAVWELIRGFTMGYTHGPEYKEGWFRILLRVMGLAIPGLSAHCPTDYVNSVRLGKDRGDCSDVVFLIYGVRKDG